MKRILSVALAVFILFGMLGFSAYAESEYPVKRENLRIRDPFVLVHDGKYYMYGTCLSRGAGYGCVISEDLENWSNPIQVFSPSDGFDSCGDYWAPECHYYKNNFYLFATYKSSVSGKRGVGIFKSSSPLGPFELISNGHITPKERDCIDGTLYIDEDGQPWMVYVNEWTSSPDEVGEMAAAKLSDDLSVFTSEPVMLFRAKEHLWTKGHVTDGAFMYKTAEGRLIMLWSNFARTGGYAVGMAVSDNGKIDGNWIHRPTAFYSEGRDFPLNGGHPMLFTSLEGELMMAIHSPNDYSEELFETASFISVEDTGNTLIMKKDSGSLLKKIETSVFDVYYALISLFANLLK